jgi:hypothetical protein
MPIAVTALGTSGAALRPPSRPGAQAALGSASCPPGRTPRSAARSWALVHGMNLIRQWTVQSVVLSRHPRQP